MVRDVPNAVLCRICRDSTKLRIVMGKVRRRARIRVRRGRKVVVELNGWDE